MRRALFLSSLWVLSACVDPAQLTGFECNDAGVCKPPASGGGTAATGGGSAATGGGSSTGGGTSAGGGGGEVTGGGGGSATGGGGGADVCSATTCTGCCDERGVCRSGTELGACGQGGLSCAVCGAATSCKSFICQPLTANGGQCTGGADCASGSCVGGLCCNGACGGACETCSAAGSEGTCTALPETTAVSACGAYACDGVSGQCPTSCTTTRQCTAGRFCDNGRCEALRAQGVACTASSQCQSGFCADGVCCDGACSGSCDKCNLTGQAGACRPSPSGDPGSPACGASVTCNGTLSDCPITCASGCPSTTYCSGTYCSAKKSNGVACGAGTECTSGNCVDGVCCDTACAGACDACSVAQGAATDGTCGLLGASRVCRAAANTCDVAERCDGASAACPANGFVSSGTSCGTSSYTAWSACSGSTACATSGTQSRTRTVAQCNGTGTCGTSMMGESQACTKVTDGQSCGTTTYSGWSTCNYASSCSTTGSRTRTRTDPLCASGACNAVQNTETDMAGCARTTENLSCGASTYGAYGACTWAGACSESGTRTRTRTDPVCQSAACGSTTAMENDTTGCTRTTTGQSCGTTTTGAWSTCGYSTACTNSGSRTRTVTTYSCGSGACNSSGMLETDTATCARNTTGSSCGTTQYGAWTTCSYAGPCSNTGSRTRSVTTYSCAAGGCAPDTTTETDMTGCARPMDGQTCSPTTYGSYTACNYTETCINSGTRTRSMSTFTCGGGTCNAAMGTDTDTAGCARNTDGTACGGAPTCGTPYSGNCSPDCFRMMTCRQDVCTAGACASQTYQEICDQGSTPRCCIGCIPQ